jgi:ligand-binding sensor domain-containing protein
MKLLVIISFILFCITIQSNSQEYSYYHYDIKDGLSGITIYTIAQDKDGFMWFGTATGLSRFDGSHFKNYTSDDGLNDNEIISLFVDSKNRVWIFPFKSSVYYYYHGKIHSSFNDTVLQKFNLNSEIFKATEDKDGNIFFLGQQKIFVLSGNDNLTTINSINGEPFYCDACGCSPEGKSRFLICFLKNLSIYRINLFTYNGKALTDNGFIDCDFARNTFQINPNYIVARTGRDFDINNLIKKKHYSTKVPEHLHGLSYVNDSLFAISTVEKTFFYNVNKAKIVDSFLTNRLVNNCFQDKEKNLWFATQNQGIYRLSSTNFKVYKLESNFNAFSVSALSRYNQYLYIGGPKYLLWRFNLLTNKIEKLNIKTDFIFNHVSMIKVIDSSTILVASNIGYSKIHNGKLAIRLVEVSVKNFLVSNDSILAATDRAVFHFPFDYKSLDTIWKGRATCAYKVNDEYYVGTLNGLYAVKKSSELSKANKKDTLLLIKDKIIAIDQSSNEDLWVATENSGLICLRNDKIIHQITTKEGLLTNLCRCIYIEGNIIWIGTNKGISKADISHTPFLIKNFTTADGLDCEIINCIYAKGDSVYAGTPYGVSFFRDQQIETKSICNLKLLDVTSEDSDWYDNQSNIHLSSTDGLLRFEYAGISFRSEGDITYYYQLKGLDTSWQTTNQNVVSYQALQSGNYQFNIYAVNKYGIKSNTVSVNFSKAKTFWELTLVRIAILLLLTAMIWFIIKTRLSAIEAKANESILRERKINEVEQMALRSQMNPHFIFNSINSIQQYVFAGDVTEANKFITDFSSLVRQTLYISGKKFITLAEEIAYIKAYLNLEKIKYENVFDFTIIIENKVDDNIPVPPLLLQPFIENSIRHGILNLENRQGNILIDFFIEETNRLICIVEDNGIGRKSAMKLKSHIFDHQSKGMELVDKRIDGLNSIYNIDISVIIKDIEENDVTGTRVKIKLPLQYDE